MMIFLWKIKSQKHSLAGRHREWAWRKENEMNFPFQHVSPYKKKVSFVSDYLVFFYTFPPHQLDSLMIFLLYFVSSSSFLFPWTALRFVRNDKKINFDEENLLFYFPLNFCCCFIQFLFKSHLSLCSCSYQHKWHLSTWKSIFKTIIVMKYFTKWKIIFNYVN